MTPYRIGPVLGIVAVLGFGLFAANQTIQLPDGSQVSAGSFAFLWEDLPEPSNVSEFQDYRTPESIQADDDWYARVQTTEISDTTSESESAIGVPTSEAPSSEEPLESDQKTGDDDTRYTEEEIRDYDCVYFNNCDPHDIDLSDPCVTNDLCDREEDIVYRDGVVYREVEPWYVDVFPGFGGFFQQIIPGQQTVYVAAPGYSYVPAPVAAPAPRPQYSQPSCWISARPSDVSYGGSVALQWASFHSTRAAIGGIGDVALQGTRTVPNVTSERNYVLNVAGPGGTGSCYTHITVKQPQRPAACIISANPERIARGQAASIAWNSENAGRATLSGVGSVNIRGGIFVQPRETTDYTLTVYNAEGRPSTCVTRILVR